MPDATGYIVIGVVVTIICGLFRTQIASMLGRSNAVKFAGVEITFASPRDADALQMKGSDLASAAELAERAFRLGAEPPPQTEPRGAIIFRRGDVLVVRRAFTARFRDTCVEASDEIHVGERITSLGSKRFAHTGCVRSVVRDVHIAPRAVDLRTAGEARRLPPRS